MSRVDEYNTLFKELANKKLRVGWFPSSKYPDGTYVAQVSLWNEFGTKSMPPRPFIRPTIANEKSTYAKYANKLVKRRGVSADDVLSDIGNLMKTDIQKTISLITEPKLSPVTLAFRRERGNSSTKPLIDTDYMITSINYDIVKR